MQNLQKAAARVGMVVKNMGSALRRAGSAIKSMVSAMKKAVEPDKTPHITLYRGKLTETYDFSIYSRKY